MKFTISYHHVVLNKFRGPILHEEEVEADSAKGALEAFKKKYDASKFSDEEVLVARLAGTELCSPKILKVA